MDVKKKIMFIVPSMAGGGSERVVSILVKHLNRDHFDITVVLLRREGEYLKLLPDDIVLIDLNVTAARFSILKIIKLIYKMKPHIVFSTLGYLNLLISVIRPLFSQSIKFIARESNTVSIQNQEEKYPVLFDLLYRLFYSNFDLIVCQAEAMRDDLKKNYNIEPGKMTVINNPVDIDYILQMSQESEHLILESNKINLLAVGRLSRQKGYDLLLQALFKLDEQYHLSILGEGEDKQSLQELAEALQIDKRVSFLGFQRNPYQYMKQADLFILSSRYEGFPNVVLEANACGTPVVAFNSPGGTGEIIEEGINGFTVEDGNIEQLTETIKRAAAFPFNSDSIRELIQKHYSVKKIIQRYTEVME